MCLQKLIRFLWPVNEQFAASKLELRITINNGLAVLLNKFNLRAAKNLMAKS